jgi:hypothetical protein
VTDEVRIKMIFFLMGAWMVGSVMMAFVATQNFRAVDRVLAAPAGADLHRKLDGISPDDARMILRHLASEMNRYYFRVWEWTQFVVGGLVLMLFVRSGRSDALVPALIVAMLAIVLVFLVFLTPTIVTLGRSLDFVSRTPLPPQYARFWRFHITYTLLELVKLLLGAGVLVRLLMR